MFWNTNSGTSTTWIDTLVESQEVNLEELLKEEELIQECRSQNKKLIDLITRPEILRGLVKITLHEPPEATNADEVLTRYRYANVACEVLTCEATQVTGALAQDEVVLTELIGFLRQPAPLNPLLASFFSRILALLVSRSPEQNWFTYQVTCLNVIEFLKQQQPDCVQLLLTHIGTSAIMDLLYKLMTKVEGPEMIKNLLNWFNEGRLIDGLIGLLYADCSASRSNASQLMCDVIFNARESILDLAPTQAVPEILAEKLESATIVARILETILKQPRKQDAIVAGVPVLLTLISSENLRSSPKRELADDTQCAIIDRLPDLLAVLDETPPVSEVQTAGGIIKPAIGAARVLVAQLLAHLWSDMSSAKKYAEKMQITLCPLIRLFFAARACNFVHAHCETALAAALQVGISDDDEYDDRIARHIFVDCKLVELITRAWIENEEEEKSDEKKKPRRGYMGHLIQLAALAKQHLSDKILEELPVEIRELWMNLLPKLNDVLELQNTKLAGGVMENTEHIDSFYQPNSTEDFGAGNDAHGMSFNDFDDINIKIENDVITFSSPSKIFASAQKDNLDDVWTSLEQCAQPSAESMESSTLDCRAWQDENSSDDEGNQPTDDDLDDWPETELPSVAGGDSSTKAPEAFINPWSSDTMQPSGNEEDDDNWADFQNFSNSLPESSPFQSNIELNSTLAVAAVVPNSDGDKTNKNVIHCASLENLECNGPDDEEIVPSRSDCACFEIEAKPRTPSPETTSSCKTSLEESSQRVVGDGLDDPQL